MQTKKIIIIFLIIGIFLRVVQWYDQFNFTDIDSLSLIRYTEKFLNYEFPEVQWIGINKEDRNLGYSLESFPPYLNLLTASFGVFLRDTPIFNHLPKIIPLIFSLVMLLIGAIYSLKVKNHYVIGFLSIFPLEWFLVFTFNNDVVVALFTSVAFLVALREINTRNVILLSLLTSLALLSKFNGVILVLSLLFYLWFSSKNLKLVLIFIAITILIAGPWYLRNLLLYGDPLFVPSMAHTEGYAVTVGVGELLVDYLEGFFPVCSLGIIETFIILLLTFFLVLFLMRGLEDRVKDMLSTKRLDLVSVYLSLLFLSWMAVRYIYTDFSNASHLIAGILPLSAIAASGIKSNYAFWILYTGFAYIILSTMLFCK